jgi:hypothetical protein
MDFTNHPTAVKVDLTNQLAAVRRQLARMERLETIADLLPPEPHLTGGMMCRARLMRRFPARESRCRF